MLALTGSAARAAEPTTGAEPPQAQPISPAQDLQCPSSFRQGEEAVYAIRYGPLPAGDLRLEILPGGDDDAWRFRAQAVSSKLVSATLA